MLTEAEAARNPVTLSVAKVKPENLATLCSLLLQLSKMRSVAAVVAVIAMAAHHIGLACAAADGKLTGQVLTQDATQRDQKWILRAVEDLNATPSVPKGGSSPPPPKLLLHPCDGGLVSPGTIPASFDQVNRRSMNDCL